MKILTIEIIKDKTHLKKKPHYISKITIGDFWETIHSSSKCWKKEQYEEQWKEGLERIKIHNSSCIIADIYCENDFYHMNIYYLYKINNKIFVNFQLWDQFKYDDIINAPLPYDPFCKDHYKNIPPYSQYNQEGEEYEWLEADFDGVIIEKEIEKNLNRQKEIALDHIPRADLIFKDPKTGKRYSSDMSNNENSRWQILDKDRRRIGICDKDLNVINRKSFENSLE